MPAETVSSLARFGGFPPRAGACRPGGSFGQRHGKPSSRARRSYSARTASLHSMLSHKAKGAAAALMASNAAREAGKGWADGSLPHRKKPLAPTTGKA